MKTIPANPRQILPPLAALLTALALVSASQAAVITSAPGGGDWYSTSSWVGGVVPQPTDDAILVSYMSYSAAVTINNLTIEASFYNGAAVTVNGNMTLSGSFTLQQGADITVGGNLEIGSGCTLDPSVANITVTGTTTVDGILKDGAGGAGNNTFNGDLVIDPGGTWSPTDVGQWNLGGNLINNGTISANTAGVTFTGSGVAISGNAVSLANLTVNGSVANQTTLTVSASLAGSGTLSQAANASLSIGAGTVTLGSLNASASPNTVTYNGNTQVVVPGSYDTLDLNGTGRKTLAGSITVNTALTVASPVTAYVTGNVTDGGTTTVASGAFLTGNGTLDGAVTVNGTLAGNSSLPGAGFGTLTLDSTPSLNGTVTLGINDAGSPNADQVDVSGNPVAFGGALVIANLGTALVAGDTFQLFSASGYSGAFGPVTLPALGANLQWNNNLASNGSISVASSVVVSNAPVLSISNSGGVLTFSWDAADFPAFYLQGQTNSSGGITTGWGAVPGGNVSPVSFPIPAGASAFFRLTNLSTP